MRALIQDNFSSGLGDAIVAIYEYLETAKTLKSFGYRVELLLNISKNRYINSENFFDIFNRNEFDIFDSVVTTREPIRQNVFQDLTKVYSLGGANAGQHWWDLFITDPINFKYEHLSIYPQSSLDVIPSKNIIIFHDNIYKEYEQIKKIHDLNIPYGAIFFRTYDDIYDCQLLYTYENTIKEIILLNNKIFICSNSLKIANQIKEFDTDKIITYGNRFGKNHIDQAKRLDLSSSELLSKTAGVIFDMLTLSDAIGITHISQWNRSSNFLIFCKINNKEIISYYGI